ncbi:membrane protein insertase YidC [Dactylosporangium sp. NPDC051485]|uniref:membrane protein insertase YidC n=1 Tax=Dactylosporangium sp. NPDC051485 TaxID=3154846 RepID=UPI0034379050
MAGIYWLISKVMLFWHTVWDSILPDHRVLSTNWQWVLAIVFLVITVRVVLFPIFVKQIKSQRAMQAIQPKMKELQEKHKGDRETLQKEVMKLYQEEKVNPLMGCLPMFLQIPVFIGLLHVLRHLRPNTSDTQMELYGWTKAEFLSAVDARLFDAPIVAKFSSSAADLITINANSTTVKIVAAFLVALMITTTYLTQRQMIKKTGWNTDPQQRMIQKFMLYGIPFFTLTSGWYFPIGVIIYWVTNNAITLAQQYWVLHKYPPPASATSSTTPFKGGTAKVAESKPSGLGALFARAREEAAAQQRTNGKSPAKAAGTKAAGAKATGTDAPADGGQSRAPKPGAKPINPKKGGAAKRQSG